MPERVLRANLVTRHIEIKRSLGHDMGGYPITVNRQVLNVHPNAVQLDTVLTRRLPQNANVFILIVPLDRGGVIDQLPVKIDRRLQIPDQINNILFDGADLMSLNRLVELTRYLTPLHEIVRIHEQLHAVTLVTDIGGHTKLMGVPLRLRQTHDLTTTNTETTKDRITLLVWCPKGTEVLLNVFTGRKANTCISHQESRLADLNVNPIRVFIDGVHQQFTQGSRHRTVLRMNHMIHHRIFVCLELQKLAACYAHADLQCPSNSIR